MAMSVKELKRWLNTLDDDGSVAIDDGGLTIQALEDPSVYCEIGGLPEEGDKPEDAAIQVIFVPAAPRTHHEHLGDGVYASWDGYQIWLAANDHRNLVVALEPAVFRRLVDYERSLAARLSNENKEG